MFDTLIGQMKKAEDITEQLKEENQMEWVRRMENTEAMARKIISSSVNI